MRPVTEKGKKWYEILLWVLIGATVLGIWSLSLRSAGSSTQQSNAVALPVIIGGGFRGDWFSYVVVLVRKLAHFAEFGVLGVWWGLYGLRRWLPCMWLYGLAVALMDEGIQYFVPGRAPGFWDVVIDYGGFFCGFALVFTVAEWWIRKKSKK